MNTITLNILAIGVVTAIAAIAYILASPEMRMRIANHIAQEDPYDDMIQKCLSDSWKMQEALLNAGSLAEVESIYWDIEYFESAYRGLVPGEFLLVQIDRLYEAVAQRRDQLGSGVKVAFS